MAQTALWLVGAACCVVLAILLPSLLRPGAGRSTGAPLALLRAHAAPGAVRVRADTRTDVTQYALSIDTPLVAGGLPPAAAHVASAGAPRATFTGVLTGEHTVWGAALDAAGRVASPVTSRAAPNFAAGGTWCGPAGTTLLLAPQGGGVLTVTAPGVGATSYCAQAARTATCHDGSSFTVGTGDTLSWTPAGGVSSAFTRVSLDAQPGACQ